MLADMLDPPVADEEDRQSVSESMAMERAAVVLDGGRTRTGSILTQSPEFTTGSVYQGTCSACLIMGKLMRCKVWC